MRGVQACVIIAILLAGISLPLAFVYNFIFSNMPNMVLAAGVMNYVAGKNIYIQSNLS